MNNPETEIQDQDQDFDFTEQESEERQQQVTPEKKQEVTPSRLEQTVERLVSTIEKTHTKDEGKEKKMSPEEEAEYYGVFDPNKVSPNFIAEYFNISKEALAENPELLKVASERFSTVQKGIVRQAVITAQRVIAPYVHELKEKLKTAEEYISQENTRKVRERFFTSYPDLEDERYSSTIKDIAGSLADKNFENEQAYFKALAEGAAERIRALLPDFALGTAKTKQPAGKTLKLPRSGVGGQGGAGKTQTAKTVKDNSDDASDSIW